jgi:hypothetical protein
LDFGCGEDLDGFPVVELERSKFIQAEKVVHMGMGVRNHADRGRAYPH